MLRSEASTKISYYLRSDNDAKVYAACPLLGRNEGGVYSPTLIPLLSFPVGMNVDSAFCFHQREVIMRGGGHSTQALVDEEQVILGNCYAGCEVHQAATPVWGGHVLAVYLVHSTGIDLELWL